VAPREDFAAVLRMRVERQLTLSTPPPVAVPVASGSSTRTVDDAMDEALDVLRGTGPEFDPFNTGFCFANHASMAAEALCALGRADAVLPRVTRYRKYLTETPRAWQPIAPDEWRAALGDYARVGDWTELFIRELAEARWTEVLDRWVPRLAPGAIGSGAHAFLRTAHAARSLGRVENAARIDELAAALAFAAARYEALPDVPGPRARLLPSQALDRVEQLPEPHRSNWMRFDEPLQKLWSLDSFATVADLVDVDADPSTVISDQSRAFAAILATNARVVMPRALVHGLTAGSATRLLLPHVSSDTARVSLRQGWQVAAAFYAAMVTEAPTVDVEPPIESIDELVDDAVRCGDEHAVKVVEACLREHALVPDPVFLVAARECTRSLLTTGVSLP